MWIVEQSVMLGAQKLENLSEIGRKAEDYIKCVFIFLSVFK